MQEYLCITRELKRWYKTPSSSPPPSLTTIELPQIQCKTTSKKENGKVELTHRTRPPHPQRQDLHRHFSHTTSAINIRLRVDFWIFFFERLGLFLICLWWN
jgi:hypothetical protein